MTEWSAHVRARRGALELDVSLHGDARPVALVGPNGSGKTTLLRALMGALDGAEVRFTLGERVVEDPERGVSLPIEARRLGYVPQGGALFAHLDVVGNVAFGLTGARRRERALELLDRMQIGALAGRRAHELSGGERQRVALARALAPGPDMLLLDEPMSALDAIARRRARRFLAEHVREVGVPTLVVTHDARDVVALDARVVVLGEGRVVQSGDLREIAESPAGAFAEEFVEGVELG